MTHDIVVSKMAIKRLSISYVFYKDVLELWFYVVKSFNSALLFIYAYAMNDVKKVCT